MPDSRQSETVFKLPSSEQLHLYRYPRYAKEQLRAWDAADEYLLNHIVDQKLVKNDSNLLILNDSFGALTLGLKKQFPSVSINVVSDSFTAQQGLLENAQTNQIDTVDLDFFNSLSMNGGKADRADREKVDGTTNKKADLVLIKVPKSLAHLEFQLSQIKYQISDSTAVIAAGMVKSIHSSTLEVFEKILGKTTTSLAKKKARLIFCKYENRENTSQTSHKEFVIPEKEAACPSPISIISYPGVFAHGKLDIGTRFLLENLGSLLEHSKNLQGEIGILDLGCGSGVLGIAAAFHNPQAHISFVDESYLAIESAKASAQKSFSDGRVAKMQFLASHALQSIEDNSQDVILNNPPFHDAAAKTANIALDMFKDSKRALKSGGQLVVIANRHLGYHIHLKRIFGNCETVTGNKKFVILISMK